jgi:hypothetical protein
MEEEIHSDPDYLYLYNNSYHFSGKDMAGANKNGSLMFLGTPGNGFLYYNGKTHMQGAFP